MPPGIGTKTFFTKPVNTEVEESGGSSSSEVKAARLEKPVRITEQVWPEGTVPVVSVFNWAYNHAAFIRESIESILMQETTFPVEIIIHDDASTDGTTEIISEYEAKYPQLFRNVIQSENQWSQEKSVMMPLFTAPRGEFVALSHGDDYWSHRHKLEIQVKLMREKPELAGCFHRTTLVDTDNKVIKQDYFISEQKQFDFRDCITKLKKQYATCSFVFRSSAISNPRPWFIESSNDMFLELQVALNGTLQFIDKSMGAYRIHAGGVWSSTTPAQKLLTLLYRYKLLLADPKVKRKVGDEIFKLIERIESKLCVKFECADILSRRSIIYKAAQFLETSVAKGRNAVDDLIKSFKA